MKSIFHWKVFLGSFIKNLRSFMNEILITFKTEQWKAKCIYTLIRVTIWWSPKSFKLGKSTWHPLAHTESLLPPFFFYFYLAICPQVTLVSVTIGISYAGKGHCAPVPLYHFQIFACGKFPVVYTNTANPSIIIKLL